MKSIWTFGKSLFQSEQAAIEYKKKSFNVRLKKYYDLTEEISRKMSERLKEGNTSYDNVVAPLKDNWAWLVQESKELNVLADEIPKETVVYEEAAEKLL